jgi:hypothetical protein
MLAEKYPIRFNTEAYDREDWEPSRLKKGHLPSKGLGANRSALRLAKGCKTDFRP